jgi:hypothetical protein
MNWFGHRPHERPFPQLLAAYVDGELDEAGRARVEAFLADHPEARADLDELKRLSRGNRKLWQASAGPSPSEASWARLFARVQQALTAPPRPAAAGTAPAPAAARPPRVRRLPALLAAAAFVLLAFALLRPNAPTDTRPVPDVEEPWAVATADDVDIVSIRGADTDLLVIGRPPLPADTQIVLATPNDVAFEKVAPDTDGMMPQMPPPGSTVAMIVVPMAGR